MKSRLVNWAACKRWLLEYSATTRHPSYVHTRVSRGEVEGMLEAKLRDEMRKLVDTQPSSGKTIKAP